MSTMLIAGLLIATTLVTFVDAGSWKIPIQEVKRVNRKNRLDPLHDVYSETLRLDRNRYRATVYVGMPPMPFRVMIDTGRAITGNCESGERVYDPEESASREELNVPFRFSYGGGTSWTQGHYFKDVFSVS
ncbi:hypothetical protein M3Y94_00032100 [Aphelenchoides besseyi]|nr:hypothetical protein M3Y94_00032100 [Aphelenchoides besseyi]